VDIEKAFDRLEWRFLRNVLESMGFSKEWIQLIGECIENVSFSIIMKGSCTRFFSSSKGLRQGDPLSP
jgi:hypothetical protein